MAGRHTALGGVENQWKSTHDLPIVSRRRNPVAAHRVIPPTAPHRGNEHARLVALPCASTCRYDGRSVTARVSTVAERDTVTAHVPVHNWRLMTNDHTSVAHADRTARGNTVLGGTGQCGRRSRTRLLRRTVRLGHPPPARSLDTGSALRDRLT